MQSIDLRSDTVTWPTPAMRAAMAQAEVGDDVYGDDPTVNRLEAASAERLGKAAALLMPSGTMGNLAALLAHCARGDEAIMGTHGHTFLHEAGGAAALGGITSSLIPNAADGTLPLEQVKAAIRLDDIHCPVSRLVVIENTQNACGGVPIGAAYMRQLSDVVRPHGLKIHVDGARLFNAAVALGVPARELVAEADSVMFCISKGLCAPVGSVLCGDEAFIHRARRLRKQLGGGMRQAGVLAAAGLIALNEMTERLAEDHARARKLAEGIAGISGLHLDHGLPATNMVYFSIAEEVGLTADEAARKLKALGVLVGPNGERQIRLVTHYWVNDSDVERTLDALQSVLK